MRGRVGALLEVGTGFHAELTGRENVFLNGAILGMRRAGDRGASSTRSSSSPRSSSFIDTPVKRYSSGMYLRLAFAVAAHLEPEILIVDEVLAVGDLAFQEKCLGRMESVAGRGPHRPVREPQPRRGAEAVPAVDPALARAVGAAGADRTRSSTPTSTRFAATRPATSLLDAIARATGGCASSMSGSRRRGGASMLPRPAATATS